MSERASQSSYSSDKRGRYLSPTQRLPEGLPSWFARCDADGDGQVLMHEFTASWTDAEVARYAKYDINGDGALTPEEVLQVEKGR